MKGLEFAWDMLFRNVVLETDSREALDLVYHPNGSHPDLNIIAQILGLLSKACTCTLQHTYREGNRCADRLAHDVVQAFNTYTGITLLQPVRKLTFRKTMKALL